MNYSWPPLLLKLLRGCCLAWIVGLGLLQSAGATAPSVTVHLFTAQGCLHCRLEKEFLAKVLPQYPQVRLVEYEISGSAANRDLLRQTAQRLQVQVAGAPFTVIGEQYFIGWLDDATTGAAMVAALERCLASPCPDLVGSLAGSRAEPVPAMEAPLPVSITLPLFGEIRTRDVSLPLFTVMMGAVDGFNPCAMWVLVFLIGLLLGLQDRRRMWLLGGTFIAVSAGIYFLFMVAWLNLMIFLGFIFWVRVLVGLVALIAGFYNLKEYFLNAPGVCKVTGNERRQRIFQKLKEITQRQQLWLALGGIVLLAFMVNLVELICSASLPVVYLQVLTLNDLPPSLYYLYILLYIFIFMLDDLIVFFVAMTTLQVTGMTGKYSRFSHLLGGLAMVAVGLLIIFKPAWLMFG